VTGPDIEILVTERDGVFCASIPSLSLVETGTDPAEVADRTYRRATLLTLTLPAAGVYAPQLRATSTGQASPRSLASLLPRRPSPRNPTEKSNSPRGPTSGRQTS
jgi:hypothetical protein